MKNLFYFLFALIFLVCSCESGPSKRANELCACAEEVGVDFSGLKDPDDFSRLERKMKDLSENKQKKAMECVLDVLKGIQDDIKEMEDEEVSEYMRSLAKAGLDTDCASDIMEDIEYDEFKDMLDDVIDEGEDRLEKM